MAFLRFSRDKRGYEHFQLIQPPVNRRGSGRPCILYWFRSPSNVRVGREPFDDATRVALEEQNPELEFDWPQILAAPIPSAEAQDWRDRRRQDRAARQLPPDQEEREPTGRHAAGDVDMKRALPLDQAAAQNLPLPTDTSSSATERQPTAPDNSARRSRRRRRGRRGAPVTTDANAAGPPAEPSAPERDFEDDPD
jgi:hypothetical protein